MRDGFIMTKKKLIEIGSHQMSQWDEFVLHHPYGWFCQLSGWKDVLENSFQHIKGHFLAILDEESNKIEAGLPIYEVRSWLTGTRLVSVPFGTLCDPLISSSGEIELLNRRVLELYDQCKASYIEIRSFFSSDLIQNEEFGHCCFFKHHYIPLDSDPEKVKKSFHRTCVRQRISRALKSDLELKVGSDLSDLREFYELYSLTRKRNGVPVQPYRFFRSLWEIFGPSNNLVLLLSLHKENAVAGIILFKFKQQVSAEFAASNITEFQQISPNHLLFWEAIKSACLEGYKVFDFGRTSPNNKSLMDFKRRWGTEVVDLPQFFYPKSATDSVLRREERWQFKTIEKLCKVMPAPFVQVLGDFCYRHMG